MPFEKPATLPSCCFQALSDYPAALPVIRIFQVLKGQGPHDSGLLQPGAPHSKCSILVQPPQSPDAVFPFRL